MIDIQEIWRKKTERAREVHEKWKTSKPTGIPKAIRYVAGFEHQEGIIPSNWEEFSARFPLEDRVKVISNSVPITWNEEYNNWISKTRETPHFDREGHYIFNGYPREIVQEGEIIKGKLTPISLRYATKDAHKDYRSECLDIWKNTLVLVFYDDAFSAQIRLENFDDVQTSSSGSDWAPSADLIVDFQNGQIIKQLWSAWAPGLQEYLEKDIRINLGEKFDSFKLVSDSYS
jgi:hypothetical protein